MRLSVSDLPFDSGNTSETLTGKDGHQYQLHRKRLLDSEVYAYSLLDIRKGEWITPYTLAEHMDNVLAHRGIV